MPLIRFIGFSIHAVSVHNNNLILAAFNSLMGTGRTRALPTASDSTRSTFNPAHRCIAGQRYPRKAISDSESICFSVRLTAYALTIRCESFISASLIEANLTRSRSSPVRERFWSGVGQSLSTTPLLIPPDLPHRIDSNPHSGEHQYSFYLDFHERILT